MLTNCQQIFNLIMQPLNRADASYWLFGADRLLGCNGGKYPVNGKEKGFEAIACRKPEEIAEVKKPSRENRP